MSEHIKYEIYLGSKVIGEVYVISNRHICTLKKPKRGLICRRASA